MPLEIDLSGKINDTRLDTIIGISNHEEWTVLVSREVKRSVLDYQRRKGSVNKHFILKLFSICIFLSIKRFLSEVELIFIDDEYPGNDIHIKRELLSRIQRLYPNFNKNAIRIAQVNKKTRAHKIAYKVFKGKEEPNASISLDDILKEM